MLRAITRNPLDAVIDRAVTLARAGQSSVGDAATHEDFTTVADADGYTVHVALTELDFTDDPHALTAGA